MKWKTGKLSAIYAMKNIQRTPAKALLTGGLMQIFARHVWFGHHTNGQLWREKRCDKRKAGVDVEAIFMGAITWAIIGICYMIYSEF